jgi:hypothetical protein
MDIFLINYKHANSFLHFTCSNALYSNEMHWCVCVLRTPITYLIHQMKVKTMHLNIYEHFALQGSNIKASLVHLLDKIVDALKQ